MLHSQLLFLYSLEAYTVTEDGKTAVRSKRERLKENKLYSCGDERDKSKLKVQSKKDRGNKG